MFSPFGGGLKGEDLSSKCHLYSARRPNHSSLRQHSNSLWCTLIVRVFFPIFLFLAFHSFAQEGYPNDTLWYDEDGRLKDEFVIHDIRFKLARWEFIEIDEYYDSSFVKAMYYKLDSLAEVIKKDSGYFEIQYHTDSRGSKSASVRYDQRRAEAIRDYLILQGVAAEKMVAKGYGESTPRVATFGQNTYKLTEEFINKFRKTDWEKFERYHQLNRRLVVKRLG